MNRYTNIPHGEIITLERDICSGYNWPGGQLAVWRSLTADGYFGADRETASDGTIYASAEEAAAAIGARLPKGPENEGES